MAETENPFEVSELSQKAHGSCGVDFPEDSKRSKSDEAKLGSGSVVFSAVVDEQSMTMKLLLGNIIKN